MAISRTAMVDDDGTLTTGTIINNAWKTQLYDQIDALFTTLGTFTFTAGGAGGNIVKAINTSAGVTNFAAFRLGNDGATIGQIALRSTTYTTAGGLMADGLDVFNDGAGGVNVIAAHASGVVRFYTAGSGSGNLRASLDASGNFLAVAKITSSGPTGGIGYATGSGGTVTQATSKTTGVTLNTVTGQITMNAAALAGGAKVSFAVSDTAVAATDGVAPWIVSGGTANAYRVNVTAVGASTFTLTVENITAGSLSEAPVIGFAVVKGVTS